MDKVAELELVKPANAGLGKIAITAKQKEVLVFVALGWRDKEIAAQLYLSHRTVESHVGNMLHATGLRDRTALAVWAVSNGVIEAPKPEAFDMQPRTQVTQFADRLVLPEIVLPGLEVSPINVGPSTWRIVDCPPLVDAHRYEPGFYWGATGGANWRFAVLFESLDDGESWQEISHCTNRSIFGVIKRRGQWGEMLVELVDGELEAISEGQKRFGGNTAISGDAVFQFGKADLVENRVYQLSDISENIAALQKGADFFLLSGYCVWHTERSHQLVRVPRLFKCLSQGQGLDDVEAVKWTNRSSWWKE